MDTMPVRAPFHARNRPSRLAHAAITFIRKLLPRPPGPSTKKHRCGTELSSIALTTAFRTARCSCVSLGSFSSKYALLALLSGTKSSGVGLGIGVATSPGTPSGLGSDAMSGNPY